MLEAVRVRREGFSYRPYFSDFFNCYGCLAYHYTDAVNRDVITVCIIQELATILTYFPTYNIIISLESPKIDYSGMHVIEIATK
jgi:hypothetical protein